MSPRRRSGQALRSGYTRPSARPDRPSARVGNRPSSLSLHTPSRDELVSLIKRMGIPVRDVLRRKGTPYDELGLDDPTLSDDQLIDAMMAHSILINRPIVVTPKGVKLCRPSETVLDILSTPQRGAFAKEDGEAVVNARGDRVSKSAP